MKYELKIEWPDFEKTKSVREIQKEINKRIDELLRRQMKVFEWPCD